jgi:hypothetical protein
VIARRNFGDSFANAFDHARPFMPENRWKRAF